MTYRAARGFSGSPTHASHLHEANPLQRLRTQIRLSLISRATTRLIDGRNWSGACSREALNCTFTTSLPSDVLGWAPSTPDVHRVSRTI
jgi:hypothetical protein